MSNKEEGEMVYQLLPVISFLYRRRLCDGKVWSQGAITPFLKFLRDNFLNRISESFKGIFALKGDKFEDLYLDEKLLGVGEFSADIALMNYVVYCGKFSSTKKIPKFNMFYLMQIKDGLDNRLFFPEIYYPLSLDVYRRQAKANALARFLIEGKYYLTPWDSFLTPLEAGNCYFIGNHDWKLCLVCNILFRLLVSPKKRLWLKRTFNQNFTEYAHIVIPYIMNYLAYNYEYLEVKFGRLVTKIEPVRTWEIDAKSLIELYRDKRNLKLLGDLVEMRLVLSPIFSIDETMSIVEEILKDANRTERNRIIALLAFSTAIADRLLVDNNLALLALAARLK